MRRSEGATPAQYIASMPLSTVARCALGAVACRPPWQEYGAPSTAWRLPVALISNGAGRPAPRIALLDAVRGGAILAMVVYHLGWDLSANNLVNFDAVEDTGWRIFARLIAGTFLLLVGINLVLAERGGFRPGPYLRRLAIIVGAALLVTIGTWWLYPEAFVYFGILHAIAAFSVLALPFLWAPIAVTAVFAVFFLVGARFLTGPVFDAPALLWLGLAETPRSSVDFVPAFPWLGVVLIGVIAGHVIVRYGDRLPVWRPDGWIGRFLVTAGRWSLPIYLIHQPVLVGLVFLVAPLIGPNDEALSRRFMNECDASCAAAGYSLEECAGYCGCVLDGLKREDDLLAQSLQKPLTDAQRDIWLGHVEACRVRMLPPPVLQGRFEGR